jgi:type I restriction enzyme S subunit
MSQAALVPKLRFSEFSDDWEEKRFVDITTKISDGIHSTPNYDEGGTYSFVNGNNLVNGVIKINSQTKKVDENEYTTHQRPLGSNTILISINGTIGNLALYNNEKVVLGKSACYLNINEKDTDKLYVFNLLRTCKIKRFFNSELTGSTIKNLSLTTIKNTKLNLPTKPEQQKIAAFLTAVDTKIEQLSKKQELLGEYKKGSMQQIFSQAIRFKADDGSDFPDWIEKKLGDVSIRGASNISANQLEDNNGGYKIYGAAGHLKNIDFYTEEDCYVAIVKDGAGAGRIMLLEAKTSVLGTLAIIKAKQGNDINFLYWLIQTINFRKYVVGSTIPHIYYRDYQAENLRIPSLSEQTKIANFLSSIDTKIKQVGKQLNESKQFKKALLQQMFV